MPQGIEKDTSTIASYKLYSVWGSYDWGLTKAGDYRQWVPGKLLRNRHPKEKIPINTLFAIGGPPVWKGVKIGTQLPPPNSFYLDVEQAHDIPLYQHEASLIAIQKFSPAQKFDDVDVLTSHNALEKLFDFVAGEANKASVLHLFLRGSTMVIEDRSARYDEKPVRDLASRVRQYGSTHLKQQEFCEPENRKRKCTAGHFRLLQYNIGPLNCVVRSLAQASFGEDLYRDIMNVETCTTRNTERSTQRVVSRSPGPNVQKRPDFPVPTHVSTAGNSKPNGGANVVESFEKHVTPLHGGAAVFTPRMGNELSGAAAKFSPKASPGVCAVIPDPRTPTVVTVPGAGSRHISITAKPNLPSQAPPSWNTGAMNSQGSTQLDALKTQQRLAVVQTEDLSNKGGVNTPLNMASLWLSRASNIIKVGHANDRIESIEYRDLRRSLEEWEASKEAQANLKRLASLLDHLRCFLEERQVKRVAGAACVATLSVDEGGHPTLRLLDGPLGWLQLPLPKHLMAAMWSETGAGLAEVVVCQDPNGKA